MIRPFAQVDVFGASPGTGNPVAVVLDGTGLDHDAMLGFARWTNLSETTFVLPPEHPDADYRVRIFTPVEELPFAGHPTLGTCHAWREHGGAQFGGGQAVQECAAGLVPVRATAAGLAFAAPPVTRDGPVDPDELATVLRACRLEPAQVADARWADNGPGWLALLLHDAEVLLGLPTPEYLDLSLGLAARAAPGLGHALEVRAFFPVAGVLVEDPVTGSLNASLAQWLLADGLLDAPYVARQGTAMSRDGRISVSTTDGGTTVWVAGATTTIVTGTVDL